MFYEIFEALCKQNGISPFACCKEIGLSGGSAAYWKKSGKTPKRETLEKLAERFGVTVDYLIGREKATDTNVDRKPTVFISYNSKDDAALIAEILSQLSESQLKQVHDYALFLANQTKSEKDE